MNKNVKNILFSTLSLGILGATVVGLQLNNIQTKISNPTTQSVVREIFSDDLLNKYKNKEILTPEIAKIVGWDNKEVNDWKTILPNILPSQKFFLKNVSSLSPKDYSDDQIISFLKSKINSEMPQNFYFEFQKCSWNIDEELGEISFQVSMGNYFDKRGNVENNISNPISITLSGFKTLGTNLIDINNNFNLNIVSKTTWTISGLLFTAFIILGSFNIYWINKIKTFNHN